MARYDSLRKLERNEKLRQFKDKHPELSWAEIGNHFGITGARAYKIYHRGKEKRKHG